jgi:hypothetical protein
MRIKLDYSCDERFFKARRVNPTNFFAELKRRNDPRFEKLVVSPALKKQ